MDTSAAKIFDEIAISLLSEKGVNSAEMPPEIYDQMKAEIVIRLITYINMVIIDNVPDENIEEYQNLVTENDQDKALEFCKNVIPNFQDLIEDAISQFSNTYLDKK